MANASADTLLESRVVAVDGLPAELHVGQKYPIITAGYFGATSTSGQVYTPPPTFNFEDLGLVLKLTPHIHGPDDVTLEVSAEFKLLGASSVDGIPVIENTKYQSEVRVMSGQWAVLAGLMTTSEASTITGIPILSYIPLLRSKTITRDNGRNVDRPEAARHHCAAGESVVGGLDRNRNAAAGRTVAAGRFHVQDA